jgi:hypothetical protein
MASGGSGKRARPSSGVTPFGSTSRLVACPICGKQVHLLLATSHVESHFGAVEGEVTTEAGPADQPADQPSCAPERDERAAVERTEASCGGAAGGSGREEEDDDESAEFGGALAPAAPAADGQAPSYVPGTDAVWVPFKLQVRLAWRLCELSEKAETRAAAAAPHAGHERRPPLLRHLHGAI